MGIVIGIVIDGVAIKFGLWSLGAFVMYRGLFLLKGPADVTTRCVTASPRYGMRAIRVVVNAFSCNADMEAQEEVCHVKFLNYLSSTTTGIEVFGVLVTPALVARLAVGVTTHLPFAIGIMQGLVHHRRGQFEC